MGDIVAVRMPTGAMDAVLPVAEELAALVGAGTVVLDIAPDTGRQAAAQLVLDELAKPRTVLAVVPNMAHSALMWSVLQHATKPVAVAPRLAVPTRAIDRALVPLDGTAEAAGALTETMRLLSGAGVQLLVLHVFEPSTVPRYWDQPAHAESVWAQHFTSQFHDVPGVRLQWRTGKPAESVLDVARSEGVDLIALGWRQRLAPGRARTLRRTVADATVPLLIVPVGSGQ